MTDAGLFKAPAARVLAVDDNRDNLYVIEQVLGDGIPELEVVTTQFPEKALELAAEQAFDCMVLDVQMPGMSGIELCRRFKAEPTTAMVPILLLTAYSAAGERKIEGLEAGADDFLSKPLENAEIVAKVNVMLRIKAAEDKLRHLNQELAQQVETKTQELYQTHKLFSLFMDNFPGAVFIKDSRHRYLYCNRYYNQFFGLRSERMGKSADQFFPEDVARKMEQHDQQALAAGEMLGDEMVPHNDGTWQVYEVRKFRIDQEQGEPFLGGIALNVSELRQANEELQRTWRIQTAVADIALHYLVDHDVRAMAEMVLKQALSLAGAELGYLADLPGPGEIRLRAISPGSWAFIKGTPAEAEFRRELDKGGGYRFKLEQVPLFARVVAGESLLSNDPEQDFGENAVLFPGHKPVAAILAVPLRLGEEVLGVILLAREQGHFSPVEQEDLHQLILSATLAFRAAQAEETRALMESQLHQNQKLESIGTLASGVAHEINNPLTGLMNYAALIQERSNDPEQVKKYAAAVLEQSRRITAIVRNLLQFSHQGSHLRELVNIAELMTKSLSLSHSTLLRDQIRIENQIPADLPLLFCQPQEIQQVLVNLVTNARHALNERYPGGDENKRLILSARLLGTTPEQVRITVEDHGCGIPQEIQNRIMDPFFTTRGRDKGTGLGLSVSHGIVLNHGGQLTVACEPGVFTRFHVDLPLSSPPKS